MKRFVLFSLLWVTSEFGLAQDLDLDGVPDHRDRCPDTARVYKNDPDFPFLAVVSPENRSSQPQSVRVDASGCALDRDNDGVADYQDYCPDDTPLEISQGVYQNGCPQQSDGDGTPDYRDNCPGTLRGTKTDNRGCPI